MTLRGLTKDQQHLLAQFVPEDYLFIGISNTNYNASIVMLKDQYGIPEIQQLCPNFDRAHELVDDIKNQLTKYGLKNNEADFDKHWKPGPERGNRCGMAKHPTKANTRIPKGSAISKDGETLANVYHMKDGNKFELGDLLCLPQNLDQKKRLVFIVVAGHGTYKTSDQIYFVNSYNKTMGYEEVQLQKQIRNAAEKSPNSYFITLIACERTNGLNVDGHLQFNLQTI